MTTVVSIHELNLPDVAGVPAAEALAIRASDPRFVVSHNGIEPMLDRLSAWLSSWFESAGMASFASTTRTLYLLLAVVVSVVLLGRWWLRRSATTPRAVIVAPPKAVPASQPWLAMASRALAGGDPRRAVQCGRLALLAGLPPSLGLKHPADREHPWLQGIAAEQWRLQLQDADSYLFGRTPMDVAAWLNSLPSKP
jgi:hypothetical protein